MRLTRLIACAVVLTALSMGVFTYYVYSTEQNWDETFHVKGSLVSPSRFEDQEGYLYAIDHPALGRYIYRAVLHAIGVYSLDIPDVDYTQGEKWNISEGRIPPLRIVIPLRFANAFFMAAAVLFVFLAANLVLKNPWLSLLVPVPLVLSERIAVGVVAYLGTDAILAFFASLALLLWLWFAMKGRAAGTAAVFAVSLCAGLCVSTKANGALVIIAYCLYLAVVGRGADRAAKPLLAGAVCALVFVISNPVIRGGGIDWVIAVGSDMLERRRSIWLTQFQTAPLSRGELVRRFFPWAPFVLPLAAALIALRRERWVMPTVFFAGTLVVGTLLSVNRTYRRYFLPVELAVYFTAGLAAWRLLQAGALRGTRKSGRQVDRRGAAAAFLMGSAAAVTLVLVLAAFEPWGPSRLRRGVSPVAKAGLFIRQAGSYFRLAERLEPKEIREHLAPRPAPRGPRPAASRTMPKPLFAPMTRQVISSAVFVAACVAMVLVGKAGLGGAWFGVLLVAPFIWTEALGKRIWIVSLSESGLALFSVLALLFLIRQCARSRDSWRSTVLVAVLSSAAAASSPSGILLAAAVASYYVAASPGRRGFGKALLFIAVASLAFLVLEPALWYLGARAPLDIVQVMRGGGLSHWAARFKGTTDFLMPLQECFPWWPLAPLLAAVLFAARKALPVPPAAVYAAWVLSLTVITMSDLQIGPSVDVTLAVSAAGGLASLLILRENIMLSVALAD